MPAKQQNLQTALTLLALAGLRRSQQWHSVVTAIPLGITEIMEWMAKHYGKRYRPNTREDVRKFSVQPMVNAALAMLSGVFATNSQDNRYVLTPEFMLLLQAYGTPAWGLGLESFIKKHGTLKRRYAKQRDLKKIPVQFNASNGNVKVLLSPGGQGPLLKSILVDFAGYFTPGAVVAYIGDTAKKFLYHDSKLLESIGIVTLPSGKMPDVILVHTKPGTDERWLVLLEAVASQGAMIPSRVEDLKRLFSVCMLGKVFVTAFADRAAMFKHGKDIAWDTEIWLASMPDHMIHYNGDRFLGPR